MLGSTPGIAYITFIADDGYGGTDSINLTVFINAGPVRIKEYTRFIYQFPTDCILIDLDSLFADPNDDMIDYQILSSIDSISVDTANQLMICPENAGVCKIFLSLGDGKGGFLEDSVEVMFNAVTGLNTIIASRLINNLKIFPNPSSGIIHLQFISNTEGMCSIRLVDLTGRIVFQADDMKAKKGTNLFVINIEGIQNKGPYLLTLLLEKAFVTTVSILTE
jgi:hypothetical protein